MGVEEVREKGTEYYGGSRKTASKRSGKKDVFEAGVRKGEVGEFRKGKYVQRK